MLPPINAAAFSLSRFSIVSGLALFAAGLFSMFFLVD